MIVKREEKDGVIDAYYSSSNVLSSTYNKTNKDLIITFNKGARYKYPNVELTDYTRFELADSQGVVFNSHIKKYAFEKLEPTNADVIVEEINKIKAEEQEFLLKARQDRLVNFMKALTTGSAPFIIYTETQLTELQKLINEYLTQLKKN